jgi:hypothetical protein
MTPDDFDEEAPPRQDVDTDSATVPAVPDECGTPPLFGDEPPAQARSATGRYAAQPGRSTPLVEQPELF